MSTMTRDMSAIDLLRSAYRDRALAQRAGASPSELGWLDAGVNMARRRCERLQVTQQTIYDTAKAVAAEVWPEVA